MKPQPGNLYLCLFYMIPIIFSYSKLVVKTLLITKQESLINFHFSENFELKHLQENVQKVSNLALRKTKTRKPY